MNIQYPQSLMRGVNSVDVIIPVLNEGKYILQCLESVLAFERPPDIHWHVFVVDGGSTDETLEVIVKVAAGHPEIELLNNPGRIQSCALNIGLRSGNGEYILRLDAHATYPRDYLTQCLQSALSSNADNVGGVVRTLPGADTYQARVVQAITTHRFGVGNSGFRLQPEAGPADTVPFGFFKRTVFELIGYFDERLVRNQDYELNCRIAASRGRIWLNPEIVVYYHNQPSIWSFLKKQFTKEGPYNAYLWYLAPYARAFRHEITGVFAAGVIGGVIGSCFSHILSIAFLSVMGLYVALAIVSSIQQAVRYKCVWHVFTLPLVFFAFHFAHGLGVMGGAVRLALGIAPVQRVREPWPGYGAYRVHPEFVFSEQPQHGAVDRPALPYIQRLRHIVWHFERGGNVKSADGTITNTLGNWKRGFDLMAAVAGLVLLSPVMAVVAVMVRASSPGPALFVQTRVGRHGRPFQCIKFRTMRMGAESLGSITTVTDSRVTPVGRVLRRYKLDELPQLWNVLMGRMSFVGPRPDVPGYADQLQGEDRQVLDLLPGITGPATLLFRDEERLLALARDPKEFNDNVIYPEKLRINRAYLKHSSFWHDIGYIVATVLPFATKYTGWDRCLGLNYDEFRARMEKAAICRGTGLSGRTMG